MKRGFLFNLFMPFQTFAKFLKREPRCVECERPTPDKRYLKGSLCRGCYGLYLGSTSEDV